ncbi:hypothetical protein ACFQX7_28455 [Luedemannella flava]
MPTIRSRIDARRGRRRRVLLAGAATLAVSVSIVAGAALLRDPDGHDTGPVTADGTPGAPRTVPAGSTAPGATARLPVYWVGADAGADPPRDVLFREFRTLPVAGGTLADKVTAAATEAVAGGPLDPDYRSGWLDGVSVRDVSVGATAVTVDLAGVHVDAANPSGGPPCGSSSGPSPPCPTCPRCGCASTAGRWTRCGRRCPSAAPCAAPTPTTCSPRSGSSRRSRATP